MAGFKDFADLAVFTAGEVDGYLMRQTAMRFATTADLLSNLVSGIREVGMIAYAGDTATYYMYEGAGVWRPFDSQWQSYTPAWTGPSSLSIGNGTLTGRWRYSGGQVFAHIELVRGSTTNAGSASYAFGLPVAAATSMGANGSGIYQDVSVPTTYTIIAYGLTTTAVAIIVPGSTRYSNTVPVAPATGDSYSFTVSYEPGSAGSIS